MQRIARWSGFLAAAVGVLVAAPARADDFEVWLVDQSNSASKTHGGTVYIWKGDDLMGDEAARALPTEVLDLGGEVASLCMASTGALPVRPHMLVFNNGNTHAALAFVASGHVVFFEAPTRRPVACLRTSSGAGGARQAHAAWPTPDDRYLLVANQNGKLVERVNTSYAANSFVLDASAVINLATCTTPSGAPCQSPALRPDNAPICPFVPRRGGATFISLRGGGLFVLDVEATPMRIIGEYDVGVVKGNGCGFIEAQGWVFFNGGGGTANHLFGFDIYRLPDRGFSALHPPNTPAVAALFSDESHDRDAHGVAATKGERFVWMLDRAANVAEVFDAPSGARLRTVDLTSAASSDPTPDLAAMAPSGNRMFVSLRGPNPLSGDPHASTGTTPGLGIIQMTENGANGYMKAVLRISNPDAMGVERADAHGIRLRRRGGCR